jgi:hypothetical protein
VVCATLVEALNQSKNYLLRIHLRRFDLELTLLSTFVGSGVFAIHSLNPEEISFPAFAKQPIIDDPIKRKQNDGFVKSSRRKARKN